MQAVVLAIITTIVGIFFAVLITRHYYKRSIKHRLAVYSMPSPSILLAVDPETRSGLSIQFRGETVKNLSVVEFLVANEGADAIRQAIEPLAFHMGDDVRIVDASITYVQPEGRKIDVQVVSEHEFQCMFALLNPGEYFYVKVIADGVIRRTDIKCTITAENIPPTVSIESAAAVSFGSEEDRRDLGLLVGAAVIFLLGAVVILPLVGLYEVHSAYFPFAWSKFHFVWWLTIPMFLVGIFGGLLVILGLVMAVGSFVGDIPPRPRFKGPSYHARGTHIGFGGASYVESESALTRYPRDEY